MLYMVTFTINIPAMLAYIPALWILWVRMCSLLRNLFDQLKWAKLANQRCIVRPPCNMAPVASCNWGILTCSRDTLQSTLNLEVFLGPSCEYQQ